LNRREREPGRTCLGCRRQRPRAELIRIVRGPDGSGCFDLEGRLPGRGAWVCPSPACLDAIAPGAVSHVLHGQVRLAPPEQRRRDVAEGLERRLVNVLTMARRMRGVVVGPTGVRAALTEGRAKLVLVAHDASPDAAASWQARADAVPVRSTLAAGPLGALFGRGPLEVAAVTVDGLAAAIVQATDRWRAFSAVSCDNERSKTDGASRAARGSAAAGGG
jgi:predicted RNA-binding protein YlxR (DUF448 family)/ribosomal protein L7Ae-like RNA K-turn-binding protein